MITLKYWNSLDQQTRSQICRALGKSGAIEGTYHHNFDYDSLGKKLKEVLETCNIQPSGDIKVGVLVKPKLAKVKTNTSTSSKTKKSSCSPQIITPPLASPSSRPKRWKFRRYTTTDPDGEWVWAHGYTESEARDEIMHDYWDTTKLDCYGLLD